MSGRAAVASAAAIAGLLLAGAGLVTPWLTVFAGLQPIIGFDLDGGYLAGIAVVALAGLLVAASAGGARWLRPAAVIGGLVVLADSLYAQGRIAGYVADPGPAALLTQPAVGSGAGLMALGGGLIVAAALIAPLRRGQMQATMTPRLLVAVGLFTTGWIHLLLAPRHYAESAILGAGFILAAVVQLALAALAVVRPRVWVWYVVLAVNAALVAIYVYAVFVGLPFGEHDHGVGLVVGAGEPIDVPGVVSKIAEIGSLAIAFVLVGRAGGGPATSGSPR